MDAARISLRDLDVPSAPFVTAVGAQTGAPAGPEARAGPRSSHVVLFNDRREILLRRLETPGLPHAGAWTSAVVAGVGPGESYASAAARGLREQLGLRLPTLRFAGKAWLDEGAERAFLGVFVAALEGSPTPPEGFAFVPVADVLRALRRDGSGLDAAFVRAFRLLHGDDEAW